MGDRLCSELIQSVLSYNPQADVNLINQAFLLASTAHNKQTRASGEAYVSHPLAVAELLSKKRLDTASIVAGLLHDTVEDTEVSLEHIKSKFGEDVYTIVDGLTKLGSVTYKSRNLSQAENFRKFLLASVKDIRVLLVKLADKMHNMRTLHYFSDADKRLRIARETIEIYVPLAERIGLRDWKAELEDHAFSFINRNAWLATHDRLENLRKSNKNLIKDVTNKIHSLIKKNGLEAVVTGREKKPYSIWQKMQADELTFERLSDIFAFRINLKTEVDCYHALGLLHSKYQGLSNRFKDYISIPKQNGYQSIHTCVLLPDGIRIEVQIRTMKMNERAEYGIAAHWHYKENGSTEANPYDGRRYRWLTSLVDILDEADDIHEFIKNSKLDLYAEAVFVFTPKGELITLPTGATPIDLAYKLHTELGHHCVGAKVNGRIIPIREPLLNGNVVEILTNSSQQPSKEWERNCITGKARSAIRRYLRSEEKLHYINIGRKMLKSRLQERGLKVTEKKWQQNLSKWSCDSIDDLMIKIGQTTISATLIINSLFPDSKKVKTSKYGNKSSKTASKANSDFVPIGGLVDRMAVKMARCCCPIPGDEIIGIIRTGRGVTIHNKKCRQMARIGKEDDIKINVFWDKDDLDQSDYMFTVRLRIVIKDVKGAMEETICIISKNNSNVSNFRTVRRNVSFKEILVNIEVSNVVELQSIINALSISRYMISVSRGII